MSDTNLKTIIDAPELDIDALATCLDGLGHDARVEAIRSMKKKTQAQIWDAADGRATNLADIVPESVGPAIEVIHSGKNSLPVFTCFEKRFCRVANDSNALYGYNEGSTRKFIGPGYFVASVDEDRGEVGVNYYDVPPQDALLPIEWPAIKSNEKGVQRLVYAKMIDYLRKVSDHVMIGRAYRKGKITNNYFLLCRGEATASSAPIEID